MVSAKPSPCVSILTFMLSSGCFSGDDSALLRSQTPANRASGWPAAAKASIRQETVIRFMRPVCGLAQRAARILGRRAVFRGPAAGLAGTTLLWPGSVQPAYDSVRHVFGHHELAVHIQLECRDYLIEWADRNLDDTAEPRERSIGLAVDCQPPATDRAGNLQRRIRSCSRACTRRGKGASGLKPVRVDSTRGQNTRARKCNAGCLGIAGRVIPQWHDRF